MVTARTLGGKGYPSCSPVGVYRGVRARERVPDVNHLNWEVSFRHGRPRTDPADHRPDRVDLDPLDHRLDPGHRRTGAELRTRGWHPPPLVLADQPSDHDPRARNAGVVVCSE